MRRRVLKIALLLSLVSGPVRVAAAEVPSADKETKRFAIVIGVNEPESKERVRLRYADDDAVAMHRLLLQAGVRSSLFTELDQDSHRLYQAPGIKGEPTLDGILAELEVMIGQMKQESRKGHIAEFLLFYSGHGNIEQGEGYVVLKRSRLTRTALLERILSRSPATVNHVIVDACKSYFLVFDKGPGGRRSPYLHPFAHSSASVDPGNTGFVLSASSDRDSHEWERFQAGVFSHEVRSALRGGADADLDGRITYAELGAFLVTANQSIANERFRPQFMVQPPGEPPGDLSKPIVTWDDSPDDLLVDVPSMGHFYVEDAGGTRVADVHPAEHQRLRLHLPRTRPLFVRKADESEEFSVKDNGPASLSSLLSKPVQIARKGALHLAFEKLFIVPFDAREVRLFEEQYELPKGPVSMQLATVEQDRSARQIGERVALWTAGISAAAGLGMTLWAIERREAGKEADQKKRQELNDAIGRLNTAAVILYSLSGAAAAAWLTLELWPDSDRDSGFLTVAPTASPDGFALSLGGKFGF